MPVSATPADRRPDQDAQRDALVERLFEATLGAWDLLGVYLGDRLGLYRTLADNKGPVTGAGLAAATGTHERYVREWLEQQAASGVLDVEDAEAALDGIRSAGSVFVEA